MKTINILPSINNMEFSGRIIDAPAFNEAKTRCTFKVLHNFGGDKDPVCINFVMFSKDGKFPECIKKGTNVIVSAFLRSNDFTGKDGRKNYRTDYIVKSVEQVKSANDFQFAGRLVNDPEVSGSRCTFRVIRNFGGDQAPLSINFVMFDKDGKFPECLKKGSPVTVKAYITSNNFERGDEKIFRNEFIVKNVEKAELVEKQVEDKTTEEEAEATQD